MNELDKKYQQLVQHLIDNGNDKDDRTGTGTLSIFDYTIRHDMSEGFPILTTKHVSFKNVVTELLWFLKGDTNIEWLLQHDCNIWVGDAYKAYIEAQGNLVSLTQPMFIQAIKTDKVFAEKYGYLGDTYGYLWRRICYNRQTFNTYGDLSEYLNTLKSDKFIVQNNEVVNFRIKDQIKDLIEQIKNNPNSRRLLVVSWNPTNVDNLTLPPCHYAFQCYVNGNKLSLKFTMRSTDVGLGLPYNLTSYGLLLCILAKECNLIPDQLIFSGGDVHLYKNHIEPIKEQLTKIPAYLPILKIDIGDKVISDVSEYEHGDFSLEGYIPHKPISLPLSN